MCDCDCHEYQSGCDGSCCDAGRGEVGGDELHSPPPQPLPDEVVEAQQEVLGFAT